MQVVLNVTEKPSIAKHLKNALQANNSVKNEKSFSKYNPVYSFSGMFKNAPCTIIITSVTGHIKNLEFDNKYSNWSETNPKILLEKAEVYSNTTSDKKGIEKNLEELIKKASDLFLWLDCDREGEAIAYEVIEICSRYKNNFGIHRAKFSSVDRREMQNAFNNPQKPNPHLNHAVMIRQEFDLRTGSAFTRFQTLLFRKYYPEAILSKFVSYGSCQFPTLAFVVDRYLRHVNFEPMKFWFLDLSIKKENITVEFNWKRERLFDEFIAKVLYSYVMEDPKVKIKKIEKIQKKRFKPYPLTTIDFQKLAVNKLKISSAKAMEIAEKLYTSGYISYPRTETNSYKNEFNFNSILEKLKGFEGFREYIEQMKFNVPRKGNKNDEAHPPIHPIKAFDKDVNSLEFKIYDLITRHFIANCSEDAVIEENNITAEVREETFTAKGTRIVEKNFLVIYEKFYTLKEKKLPFFEDGEIIDPSALFVKQSQTTAPTLLSESDLIILMDKNGIGTDATIHEHINTIQKRCYAIKKGKYFVPTQLGIALLVAYQDLNLDLGNPFKRAEIEQSLNLVANGVLNKNEVLKKILNDMILAYIILDQNKNTFLDKFICYFQKFKDLKSIEPANNNN